MTSSVARRRGSRPTSSRMLAGVALLVALALAGCRPCQPKACPSCPPPPPARVAKAPPPPPCSLVPEKVEPDDRLISANDLTGTITMPLRVFGEYEAQAEALRVRVALLMRCYAAAGGAVEELMP